MPKKLILLRHGQTTFNAGRLVQGHLDAFLDDVGHKQAIEVARSLAPEAVDHIFSSDLKRAYHTALVVAEKFNLPVQTTPKLRERSYGKLEGLSWQEIKRMCWRFESTWNFRELDWHAVFDLERRSGFRGRIAQFLKSLKKHRDKTILVVSHGGTIRVMLSLMGFTDAFVKSLTIKNTGIIRLVKKSSGYAMVPSSHIEVPHQASS